MSRKWVVGVLCAGFMLFGMSISGWANTQLQEIKAYLNGEVTVHMDGEQVEITDASGNKTSPITYEGTTYLPIRSISGLLDIDVYYEAQTKEIYLGDRPESGPPAEDGSIQLISSSDRTENGETIVTGSVHNRTGEGETVGIVVVGFDANGNALETKGSSGFVATDSVRNFTVKLNAQNIDKVEVQAIGYAKDITLLSEAAHTDDGKLNVSAVVENGRDQGHTTGIVVTTYDQAGNALETKGTSGFVSTGSSRNYSVKLDEVDRVDRIEVQAIGFENRVKLLSDASYKADGKVVVTGVVENGKDEGQTAGIVATGYDKNGKSVETKGSSGFIATGSSRNFSVKLDAGSEIDYVEVKVTEND